MKFAIAVNVIKKQNESSIRKNENEKKLNELKELKEKLILKNLKDVISDVDYKEQVAVLDNRIFELEKESILVQRGVKFALIKH
ncbi:MAG: hypothetical protein IPK10_15830 [Bacteroidetes bacterium]|nr:hypothetical protein [Bacteroidota bacterium]